MSENNTNPNKNWLTEEEAIALASGVSVEKAAAMIEGAGDWIKKGREVYRIKAGRRTDVPTTSNFSIATIQCRNCGASFNSFKTRNCPYCGSASEPASDDWVIHEVKEAGQSYMLKPLLIVLAILVLIVIGGLANLGIIH